MSAHIFAKLPLSSSAFVEGEKVRARCTDILTKKKELWSSRTSRLVEFERPQ